MNLTSFIANKCFAFLLNTHWQSNGRQQVGDALPSRAANTSSSSPLFLPPWVQNARALQIHCDGCGSCLAACEKSILVRDKDGYPQVDFSRGSCSFCRSCVASCSRDVFEREESALPWTIKARINADCLCHNNVLCRTCAEYCEYSAIVFEKPAGTMSVPKISAEKCNGCGACFGPCPVRAIAIVDTGKSEQP